MTTRGKPSDVASVVLAVLKRASEVRERLGYDELVQGLVRDDSRAAYVDVVRRLVDRGAQGVVLGCTEIELLLGADDVPVPVFATTRLHALAAVDFALS